MRAKFFAMMGLLMLAVSGACAEEPAPPAELNGLDPEVRQVIAVTSDTSSSVNATIVLWQKSTENNAEAWHPDNVAPIAAVLGRNGLSPAGQKREGDGRTPSGIYSIYRSFGYPEPVKTELEYHPVNAQDFWIDDPASIWYNQWVTGAVPAASHEKLLREDGLYKYAIIVEYNTDPVIPGNGSAIFIHVWRGPGEPTAGCVAMAENDIVKILGWLKRDANPVVLIHVKEAGRS